MRVITTAFLAACLAGSAHAQTAPADSSVAPAAAVARADARRDAHAEEHIKALHTRLQITAPQEPLWNTVATTMRDNASQIDVAIDKRESMIATASAMDDLNAYAGVAQAHADSVKKLAAAFAPLYAAMPAEQKKIADEVFTHREKAGRKMGHKQASQ